MSDSVPRILRAVAKYRSPVGIFEAAMLLVVVAGAVWMAAPVPRARRAAEEEKQAHAVIGALADALEARMAPPRSLPPLPLERLAKEDPAAARLLAEFGPSGKPWVLGSRTHWIAVLLPGKEGVLAAPGQEDPAEAMRGFCVLAWHREGASPVLRELAALAQGFMWQRAEGMKKFNDPALPPVPRAAFPQAGSSGGRVPDPPPDWTLAKRRR